MFLARFKDLAFAEPEISITRQGDTATFTAPAFVWGVCLDLDGESAVADNIFDLLPGIPHTIPWPTGEADPKVLRTGNGLVKAAVATVLAG